MEILREEFERRLPDIEKAVAECDFVAMDTEMSGLASPGAIPKNIDSLQTRYQKVAANASNFLVMQLGICTFTWSDEKKAYIARPFNFPCFPASSEGGRAGERFFRCQSTSLEFLIQNGFDFNKWIKHGIPYMTRAEEAQFLTRKAEKEVNRSQLTDIKIEERNREFYENTRRLVHQIVRNDHGDNLHVVANPQARTMTLQRMTDELRKEAEEARLPKPPTLNLRRILDMITKAKKPLIGHNCFLDLMQITEQYLWDLPQDLTQWKEMLHAEWETIVDTKHLASHPTIAPLMDGNTGLENVSETVRKDPFKTVGPRIVMADGFDRYGAAEDEDTSASVSPNDSNQESNTNGAGNGKKDEKNNKSNSLAYHEAGYDAFITGQAFLRFAGLTIKTKERSIQEEHQQKRRKISHSNANSSNMDKEGSQEDSQSEGQAEDDNNDEEEDEDGEIVESEEEKRTILSNPTLEFLQSDELRPYYNRLHMMRSDIPVMHLDGPEPEPEDRPLQFMLRNIPSNIKTSTLFILFEKWSPQRFIWIDDTSCWILLKDIRVDTTDELAVATTEEGTASPEKEPNEVAPTVHSTLTPGILGEEHVRSLCVGMEDKAIQGREAAGPSSQEQQYAPDSDNSGDAAATAGTKRKRVGSDEAGRDGNLKVVAIVTTDEAQ
ncbi:hypothetical protein BGW41_001454 [Actinomortierella wolfii]|nr:hypothetical protein BGW41_001454 [Actinomortierella wolfii]